MRTDGLEYGLRAAAEADGAFLFELFCENRRDEFAPLGLPPEALEPLLRMQFRARNAGYAGQFPGAKSWVVEIGGHAVGAFTVDSGAEGMHLVDIAVSRAAQGRGLGTRVVAALVEEARAKGVPLRLSVRFDNPAIRLYQRLGFVRTGGDGMNFAMEIRAEAGPSPEMAETAADEAGAAEAMSGRWFRRLVGQTMAARSEDGVEVVLTLKGVTALKAYGKDIEVGDSFSLEFRGPLTPVLPPAMTTLTPHTTLTAGDGEDQDLSLFLSPTGPREGAMRYEAVFNRMRPTTGSSR